MKIPAYPRTKASGVEWLGDVPEHWETKKVTYGFSRIGSGTTPKSDSDDFYDGDVPWVTTSELRETVITKTKACVTRSALAAYSALRLYPTGTLLFAMYGATIGRLGILGIPATLNQACCAFATPTLFDTRFVFYWLWMRRPILISLSTGGGQPNLSQDDLRQIRISTPPLPEQRAIAAFLDRETGRVDRLVVKKRELIERLKEKRTALISRTVTRGLPPAAARAAGLPANPPLKPSPRDRLGDIPKHGEVRKFSREVAIAEGQVDPEKEPYASMLLIGPEHVESGTGRLLQRATAADQAAESGKYFSRKGDVIYSKIRPALRKLVIAPEDCLCSADMYPLRARKRLDNRFIAWFFLSEEFSGWSVLESDRVAMPKINRDTLNELRMPVPPLPEQAAIAAYLDLDTAKLDALVGKVEEAVERLQEYRTALITAAVTGKIDVRKVAT